MRNWEFIIKTSYLKQMMVVKRINKNKDFCKFKKSYKTKEALTEVNKAAKRTSKQLEVMDFSTKT